VSEVGIKPKTFSDLFLEGEATADAADDFIDRWHDSGDEERRPLTKYLGMTDEVYELWMMDRRMLPEIVSARRPGGLPLITLATEYMRRMLAANDPIDRTALFALGHWLRARGVDRA